jgi:hypothetical protein
MKTGYGCALGLSERVTELLVRWSQEDDATLAELTPPTSDYCEMPFETIFHRPNDTQGQLRVRGARKSTSNAKSRRIHGTLRLLLVISQAA